jgi:hypothetical protein
MKLRTLCEDMEAMDVIEAIFNNVLADPAIKWSYEILRRAAGRLIFISPADEGVGIIGSWAIYGSHPNKERRLIFGLGSQSGAEAGYNLPMEILDKRDVRSYDLHSPEDVERMEDTIKRYLIEFENRNYYER